MNFKSYGEFYSTVENDVISAVCGISDKIKKSTVCVYQSLNHADLCLVISSECPKTAVFAAALFELMGYDVSPRWNDPRADIIQSVTLGCPNKLVALCQGLQSGAPVDAFVSPEPWDMPGYDSQVIMAAGAFTMGASIELSADAPLREPYAAWLQGGLNFHSAKMGVLFGAQRLMETTR